MNAVATLAGRIRGTWTRPDVQTWQTTFAHLRIEPFTVPQADVATLTYGYGLSIRMVCKIRGNLRPSTVKQHLDGFHRKATEQYLGHFTSPYTAICALTRSTSAQTQADSFAFFDRLMRKPPVGIYHRTARDRLRAGSPLCAELGEDACTIKGTDCQTASHTRNDLLYRETLRARRIAEATSWQELVVLDDEAPADLLVRFDLLAAWRAERTEHGRRRGRPRWQSQIPNTEHFSG